MRPPELKICGMAAVRARFQANPGSIARLYFDAPTSKRIGLMCRALAAARKIYRCVEPDELARVAGSVHHGGIVAVVAAPVPCAATAVEAAAWVRRRESVVVLDRIGNAHNLGAIVRTAAFFGVPHLAIAADPAAAQPGEAAYRVAEGGFEFLQVWTVADVAAFLGLLTAAGFDVVGAATRGGALRPGKGRPAGPWALVLGNEERGLEPAVAAACTRLLTIPGGGRVESLNVSVAAAVLMHELGRKGG